MFKSFRNKNNSKKMMLVYLLMMFFFIITFGAYVFGKIANPKIIVGGNSDKVKHNYSVVVKNNTSVSNHNFKYVFDNGNRCELNYPLGAPILQYNIADKTALFCYQKYAVQYNTETKTPIWESHVLRKADFKQGQYVERSNDFREDSKIAGQRVSAKPTDYTRTGWDRGHLAPAADFSYSEKAMSESFIMTNIAPQAPMHNRQIWSNLEQSVRKLLRHPKINELYITTGVLYYQDVNNKFGNQEGSLGSFNGIKIPTFFYKIIIEPQSGQSAAYLIPNTNNVGNNKFNQYLIKIRDLEGLARIDFNSELSTEMATAIEVNGGSLDKSLQ